MGAIVESASLFAQSVNLAGPASLVRFLTVLGEAGAFQGGRELGRQFGDIARAWRDSDRRGRLRLDRLAEEAIDAADSARGAVTTDEFVA